MPKTGDLVGCSGYPAVNHVEEPREDDHEAGRPEPAERKQIRGRHVDDKAEKRQEVGIDTEKRKPRTISRMTLPRRDRLPACKSFVLPTLTPILR